MTPWCGGQSNFSCSRWNFDRFKIACSSGRVSAGAVLVVISTPPSGWSGRRDRLAPTYLNMHDRMFSALGGHALSCKPGSRTSCRAGLSWRPPQWAGMSADGKFGSHQCATVRGRADVE